MLLRHLFIFLLLNFYSNTYSQNKIIDYSLPNHKIVIDFENNTDSTYSGKTILNIFDINNQLINTISVDYFKLEKGKNNINKLIDCLVDFNNDGYNDIIVMTHYSDIAKNRMYTVYLFDKVKNNFVESAIATHFKNANKEKIILSSRTKDRLSVYDINNEKLRQISEYKFNKTGFQKVKTTIEDFGSEEKYVIVTTTNKNKKYKIKYLKKTYIMDE